MKQPDYRTSIVNLVASLAGLYGAEPGMYAPLEQLEVVQPGDRPLLLIVDGLGDNFLRRYPDSFLFKHRRQRLFSVFPPTTASAVTSFFTGTAPQQHAVTGWYTYFRELGTVATVLPFMSRYGGAGFGEAGISPAQLIGSEPLLNTLPVPSHVILPRHLVDSEYSRTLSGPANRYGYADLREMFSLLHNRVEEDKQGLIIAYFADLDSVAHQYGMKSSEAETLFREFDDCCREQFPRIAGTGRPIILTADHGLIDCPAEKEIHLDDHPRLAAMLTLPLCGEPRCAYCYVRAGSREEFEHYITVELSHACMLKESQDMIDQGYFGLGSPSPLLAERVGDYILLLRDNYTIRDRLVTEKPYRMNGVHGGLSADELFVPLIVFDK